jgi:hypothetical protein
MAMLAELAVGLVLLGSAGERTVPCTEVVQTVRFPYAGSVRYPSQLVLDAVSAPGKHLPQSSETGAPPWRWFSKWGLVVRGGAGPPVVVSVPRTWRTRVAIAWGNGGHGVFHTLRFPRCGEEAGSGNAYAGGFFLRRPSGCVPLRFTVDTRTTLVWFGIVRRCRGR